MRRFKLRPGVRRDAFARSRGRCIMCGFIPSKLGRRADAHHVLDKAKFPQHAQTVENVVLLCDVCHGRHTLAFRRLTPDELHPDTRAWVATLPGPEQVYFERIYR